MPYSKAPRITRMSFTPKLRRSTFGAEWAIAPKVSILGRFWCKASEGQEIRASHEEVEAFVGKLRGFHEGLDPAGRAMLGTILEAAQGGETGGYKYRWSRYGDPEEGGGSPSEAEGWNDLIGWIEEQGEDDARGFYYRKF